MMSDTTDQQAVTVAQDDEWHRALAIKRYADPAVQRVAYLLACQLGLLGKGQLTDFHEGQCAISAAESMVEGVRSTDSRLASVSSASAEGFLAEIHKRTSTGAWIAVQHHLDGDWSVAEHPLPWLPGASPEPVPATNQAGEVEERDSLIRAHGMKSWSGGLEAPTDWNGGRVLLADDQIWHPFQSDDAPNWQHDVSETGCLEPGCIVGYSTKVAIAKDVDPDLADAERISRGYCGDVSVPAVLNGIKHGRETAASSDSNLRRQLLRATLCLGGFIGNGLSVDQHEDPVDVYGDAAEALGLPHADDDDLAVALSEMEENAALATQPATSQEGEAVREAFSGVMRGEVVNAGAWSLHLHFGRGDGARDRMRAASSLLGSIVAATPTPPTLSEDLREALEPFAKVAKHMGERQNIHVIGWNGDNVTYADFRRLAALAQVKAS